MANPYPAEFQVAENLHVRLEGDITFTDPSNQPGGGGGGSVNSVTAGDSSITIAGTATDPTVAVAALGVTSAKIASGAVTQAKLGAKAVGAAEMDSGAATANWVPVADGTGGVVYAASPGVNSLTAADASVVVAGTAQSPTVRTGTLDTIATQHPPTAAVALNSQKITGLANGTVSSDAAAFGQIPTALPPNGSAGGDLSGTYPNPTVAAVEGVAVSGTAPSAGQVLTASDATHAAWATPSAGSGYTVAAYAEVTSNTSITANTEATATTVVTAGSITADGSAAYLVEMYAALARGSTSASLTVVLYDGSSSIGHVAQLDFPDSTHGAPVNAAYRLIPSAASHTYSFRAYMTGTATATVFAGAAGSGNAVPAYILITKLV